ncbi:MAG: dTDP-4-amino-4,6-dideoxygalactose transaminase [Bacteroidetes bacterium]|nr:dTDP-4-amino-4,6-dideoxygalactose transaminase [Bacteroidota bacterium]
MIPFNKPYYSGKEKSYIVKAMNTKILTGDIAMLRYCENFLEKKYNFKKVFLTNSCTMALEMAAVLADIQPGDEVIMPSYTYVSTANAFALRGAKIVFADSKSDQPNMDENAIAQLITSRTKAIVVVHYAGISCDFSIIKAVAHKHNIMIIEDAAQCIDSFYKNEPLGSIGDIACFSFHETKNIHCGEGGFIVINDQKMRQRAERIRNKGTNRSEFMKGEVNKYEWVDLGFSSMPSAITAAFLFAQMENIEQVQKRRIKLWKKYYTSLKPLQKSNHIALPVIPEYASNNAHLFYFVCGSQDERNDLIQFFTLNDILAVFHYQALHSSPFFQNKHDGRELANADKYAQRLVRLPLFYDLTSKEQDLIISKMFEFYSDKNVRN